LWSRHWFCSFAVTEVNKTYKIFLTAVTNYQGNFGGVAAADTICAADTNNPGDGTYKAMVVAGTDRRACTSSNCTTSGAAEHIDWVLQASSVYTRVDGTVIGTTNSVGLLNFPLQNSLLPGAGFAWAHTGLGRFDWNTSHNCSNWTSNAGSPTLTSAGEPHSIGSDFIRAGGWCDTQGGIYCVEQP
jgi:hypothetical protein